MPKLNILSLLMWAMLLAGAALADIIEVTPKGEARDLQRTTIVFTQKSAKSVAPSKPPIKPHTPNPTAYPVSKPTAHPVSKPTVVHEPSSSKSKGGKGGKGDSDESSSSKSKGGKGDSDGSSSSKSKGGKGDSDGKGGKGNKRGKRFQDYRPGGKITGSTKNGKGKGKGRSSGMDTPSASKSKGKGKTPGPPIDNMMPSKPSPKNPVDRPPVMPSAPIAPTAPSTPSMPSAPSAPSVPSTPSTPSATSAPTDNPPPSDTTLAPTPTNADSVSSSTYTLSYTTTTSRLPTIAEYDAVTSLTRVYLSEFATEEFGRTSLTMLDDFLTVQLRNSFTLNQPIEAEYQSTGLFDPSSIFLPTSGELDGLIVRAFTGDNLIEYIRRLNALPASNVFSTTADVDVETGSGVGTTSADSPDSPSMQTQGSQTSQATMAGSIAASAAVLGLLTGFLVYRRRKAGGGSVFSAKFADKDMKDSDMTVAGDTYCDDGSVSVMRGRMVSGPSGGAPGPIYEFDDDDQSESEMDPSDRDHFNQRMQ